MVAGTPVTDTLLWDGPASLDEYRAALARFAAASPPGGDQHFVIESDGAAIGMIGVRPLSDFRGDVGLWIAQDHQGRGHGTEVVRLVTGYGFGRMGLQKLEAGVFVGNHSSRRIFEKNGYRLEGTVRRAVRKRGRLLDEWRLGLVPEDFRG